MIYAVNAAGTGWRAIGSVDDLLPGETISDKEVVLAVTYAQELADINSSYAVGRLALCQAWLVAAVADGSSENGRKLDVEEELAELDAQHAESIVALKNKYGVS
jgi:hypothetical protein